MLGKILGAIAGERIAKRVSGVNGTGGAVIGVGAAAMLRRLGPIGLIAATVGGYALKKHFDKKDAARPTGRYLP